MKKEEFAELVQEARQADLVRYFQSSGYTVDKKSGNYYIKEFPGLCIKPETNQWYNHYENVGRTNNSIDCLTLVCGRSFNQAVHELTGQDIGATRSASNSKSESPKKITPLKPTVSDKEKKELHMPEQAPNMRRMFAYFCQTRKIPSEIVEELVHAKLLYQSQNTVKSTANGVSQNLKNANAVFVHRDNDGNVVGGEIQGCNSFKRYKGIASGTGDSAFMFTPVPAKDGKLKRAYIFERAIDLMSFYSFCDKRKLEGAVLVSMAGLKPTVPKKLQEDGIQIISCVDNDDAGRKFEAEKIMNGNSKRGAVEVFLSRGFFNSIVSVLSNFIVADETNKYSVYALRLKNKILRYGRKFVHNEEENVAFYFYEDEAAILIKLCAIYINATEQSTMDYFS
ncbi:MAG: DUF3991 domain-containing protein, partial [Ruminococcus sp.]